MLNEFCPFVGFALIYNPRVAALKLFRYSAVHVRYDGHLKAVEVARDALRLPTKKASATSD
jgi:hypothetical protein